MIRSSIFILITLLLNGLAGLAGGLISDRALSRYQAVLVSMAAGALLTAAFTNVLPEALEAFGTRALVWAFGGFLVTAAVEFFLGHHHHGEAHTHDHEHDHVHDHAHGHTPPRTLPASLLVSDALHNIADGAAVAASFLVSAKAGVAVGLAVILHEVPQEVGDYALLRSAGYTRRRALAALAAVQLTAVMGAAGVVLAAGRFDQVTAAVLSLAAGSFLYIGATDLLPELHAARTREARRQNVLGFVAGVGLLAVASLVESLAL